MHRLKTFAAAAAWFVARAFGKPWPPQTWWWLVATAVVGTLFGRKLIDLRDGLSPSTIALGTTVLAFWVFLDKANPGTSNKDESDAFSDVVDLVAATTAVFALASVVGELTTKHGVAFVGHAGAALAGFAIVVGLALVLVTKQRERHAPAPDPTSAPTPVPD